MLIGWAPGKRGIWWSHALLEGFEVLRIHLRTRPRVVGFQLVGRWFCTFLDWLVIRRANINQMIHFPCSSSDEIWGHLDVENLWPCNWIGPVSDSSVTVLMIRSISGFNASNQSIPTMTSNPPSGNTLSDANSWWFWTVHGTVEQFLITLQFCSIGNFNSSWFGHRLQSLEFPHTTGAGPVLGFQRPGAEVKHRGP